MGNRKRTTRDRRRRALGQNFLARPHHIEGFLAGADLADDDHVVEFGAGTGALTVPLARRVGRVTAVERDPAWAKQLRDRLRAAGLDDRVHVLRVDLRHYRLPAQPYRVMANPPFGLTTALLRKLLDDPSRGPERADLLLQREVAVKRSQQPPATLLSAGWAPWWTFELGAVVPRQAFRPVPRVDAAWLTVRRRDEPVLPTWMAASLPHALRPLWTPPHTVERRHGGRQGVDIVRA